MSQTGLFYGTQAGNTQTIAETIQKEIGGNSMVTLHNVANAGIGDFDSYQYIIGCPTWNVGELQADWERMYDELDTVNFSGKKIAYFGPGDQVGYAITFRVRSAFWKRRS